MKRKKTYTAPLAETVHIETAGNIAQFIVSSGSVGEEDGLAKPGNFFDDDEYDDDPWDENED